MKKLLFIAISLIFILPAFSQEVEEEKSIEKEKKQRSDEISTIFGHIRSNGGYGGVTVSYAQIDGKDGIMLGGKGAWIIGHGLGIGFGGAGFFNDYHLNSLGENVNLAGGYGGFFLEPILLPKFPAHISIPVFFGVGGISYINDEYDGFFDNWDKNIEDSDEFLILQPGVELEFNLLRHFRMSLGAYYSYTTKINLIYTDPEVLNGISFGITFKFGKF